MTSKVNESPSEKNVGSPDLENIHDQESDTLIVKKSLGVRKIEIISKQYGMIGKVITYFTIFIIGYCYSLDSNTRYVYTAVATSSYSEHSLLSTVNVILAVIAAASQPVIARLSDVFGRLELYLISVMFFVIGTILESQSQTIQRYAGGAVLYEVGYCGIVLMLQILIADLSFLNWRLFCSIIPSLPFILNTWISGNVTSAMGTHWSWGVGMWAIILPVVSIPLVVMLLDMKRRAKNTPEWEELKDEKNDFQRLGWKDFFIHLFWMLDVIGIFLLVASLILLLVPFTIAGGVKTEWQKAKIIAPIVIGALLVPVFLVWEGRTENPIAPLHLLKDRGIWAALNISFLIDFIFEIQASYLYTVLIIAVNESVKSATRISTLASFVSCVVCFFLGLIVVKFRRLKVLICFGTSLWMVSMGMLVHFRGGESSHAGIIGSLIVMGFGTAFFTMPTQTTLQSCVGHEYTAIVTSLNYTVYRVGAAVGSAIAGAIWSQLLPKKIQKYLGSDLEASAYGAPFEFILTYTWDTPERQKLVLAYQEIEKILMIVALVFCVPLVASAFALRDRKLGEFQSYENDKKAGYEHETEKAETWKDWFKFK